jgi:hypothetical protein
VLSVSDDARYKYEMLCVPRNAELRFRVLPHGNVGKPLMSAFATNDRRQRCNVWQDLMPESRAQRGLERITHGVGSLYQFI